MSADQIPTTSSHFPQVVDYGRKRKPVREAGSRKKKRHKEDDSLLEKELEITPKEYPHDDLYHFVNITKEVYRKNIANKSEVDHSRNFVDYDDITVDGQAWRYRLLPKFQQKLAERVDLSQNLSLNISFSIAMSSN